MDNEKFAEIFTHQSEGVYYGAKELMYGNKPGFFLSAYDYQRYLDYLDRHIDEKDWRLPSPSLKVFNGHRLHYCLSGDVLSLINGNITLGRQLRSMVSYDELKRSRIYSEIEGSVNIESVPTTRRRLKELLEEGATATSVNDRIIQNMKAGIDFVETCPPFNESNLHTLYLLLSEGCLQEDNLLREGELYRYDEVEIDSYHGCPATMIPECMASLFAYVNDVLTDEESNERILSLLPHICHYYLVYIHPYFDYNGRTARMVSYWIYLLTGSPFIPPIASEAVQQTKSKYYAAIEQSRDARNDITYFLKYMLGIVGDYAICYQNVIEMDAMLSKHGILLTEVERNYLKRILISSDGLFHYADFLRFAHTTMSKQGALKILNRFVDYGLLREVITPSKTKFFEVNQGVIPYRMKHLGTRK